MRNKLRRLREQDTRRLVAVILGGKMLGIVSLLGVMKGFGWLFESTAGASPLAQVAHEAGDFVSPINTVWVLVTAFLVFFMQAGFAFADTASTITSGAMVGRTGFKGDILYSATVSGFIYPIFGHWVWGPGGWLGNTMGWFHGMAGGAVFRDFAGSTVVHEADHVDPGIVEPAGVAGGRARRARHLRARLARLPHGVRSGHDLHLRSGLPRGRSEEVGPRRREAGERAEHLTAHLALAHPAS